MKKRLGFVSNSSSSSFVIVGKEIDWSESEKHKNIYFVGDSYIEGTEAFEVDDFFRRRYKNKKFSFCKFFDFIKTASDEHSERFTKEEIEKLTTDYKIIPLVADYHSRYPDYIDEFEETYSVTEAEVKKNEMQIKLCE